MSDASEVVLAHISVSEQMSQARCLCRAEKRMKVSGSQRAKLKRFYGLTKEVASTGMERRWWVAS